MAGMSEPFTETTTQSWISRLGGALMGVIFGLVLLAVAGWLAFWNEGRAITTARSLSEGAGLVVGVDATRPDPANAGRLVHVAAPVRVAEIPRDGLLGSAPPPGTLRLLRTVEMFQWREEERSETRTKLGGGTETVTTFSYTRGWQEGRVDSSRFRRPEGHENPQPTHASRSFTAPGAMLGGFRLTAQQLEAIPAEDALGEPRVIGADPANPRVGDLRVTWRVARPEALSVVAAQMGEGFGPFPTRAGDRLFLLETGQVPAAAMFRAAEQQNAILTWALRAGMAVLVFIGFALVLNPLKVLADIIPPLGAVVGFGTGFVALVLTLLVAPALVALAWLAVRPVLALALLAGGALAAYAALRWRRAARPAIA